VCCRCSGRSRGTPKYHLLGSVRDDVSFDSRVLKLLPCWWHERLRSALPRLCPSGAQAGGVLTWLSPAVRASAHHGSALLSILPPPGTVLGPVLLVAHGL